MAEQQDPEISYVPEHDLSEDDMMFVSLLYNYILASLLFSLNKYLSHLFSLHILPVALVDYSL